MPTRTYNNQNRLQQQEELKARIAAAASRLHALQGGLGTSWADIAREAGVSLPTVHKHFPDYETLIPACTGHAAAGAPPFPAEQILQCTDLLGAAEVLVDATDRIHAYFEPWAAWGEHRRLAPLGELVERRRAEVTAFCHGLLKRHLGQVPQLPQWAATWETLLSFDVWHGLVRHHKLSRAAARRITLDLMLAVTGPQPASHSSQRPTRRSQP